MRKIVNGQPVELTAEEEAVIQAEREVSIANSAVEAEARVQATADKASAKAKLIAGEALTEAEADTIVI